MPSKPPRSKAAKKSAKTAKKLPGNILKRFKLKKLENEKEELIWKQKNENENEKKSKNQNKNENETIIIKKKGITNRIMKAKQRERVNLSLS